MGQFRLLNFIGTVIKHLPEKGKPDLYYLDRRNQVYQYRNCIWERLKIHCEFTFLDISKQIVYIIDPKECERIIYPTSSLLLDCEKAKIYKYDCRRCVWKPACCLKKKAQIGPTGPTGAQGPTGENGAQGVQGPAGENGAQGAQGPAGENGAQGAQGPAGETGAQGAQGPAGENGAQGAQGPPGNDGAQGAQGPPGNDGAQGAQGPPGETGAQGAQGPAGNDGAQGAQGPAGETGAQGAQGPPGDNGAQGAQGELEFFIETNCGGTFSGQSTSAWVPIPNTANIGLITTGGALVRKCPDGTVLGGDQRGSEATDWQETRTVSSQVASGIRSVISGGSENTAFGQNSTVGGGLNNNASGNFSVIAGGSNNSAAGENSAILGGITNLAPAMNATVGGGESNSASGLASFVGGGRDNTASGVNATVAGGSNNTANAPHSTIAGGSNNTAADQYATVSGGSNNQATFLESTISGGILNIAGALSATVSGGRSNNALGTNSTVGGGRLNIASGDGSMIGGGTNNRATGLRSIVVGGFGNETDSISSIIGGGESNLIQNSTYAVIAGGNDNLITNSPESTISGGIDHQITTSANASIAGGDANIISGGDFSFAVGQDNNLSARWQAALGLGHNLLFDYQAAVGRFSDATFASGASGASGTRYFMVGNGVDASNRSNYFSVTDWNAGTAYAPGGFVTAGADFGEYFESALAESAESSLETKIPLGTSVVLIGEKIDQASKHPDILPIGVISNTASFVGNEHEIWPKKYLRDENGELIFETTFKMVEVTKTEPKVIEKTIQKESIEDGKPVILLQKILETVQIPLTQSIPIKDEKGKVIGEKAIPITEQQLQPVTGYKVNPEYDSSKTYVPRRFRPEWNLVGLVGRVKIRKGERIHPNWLYIKEYNDSFDLYLIR